MPIDFIKIRQEAWAKNCNDISLDEPYVLTKVHNWAKDRGIIDFENLYREIKECKYFKMVFAKDPSKQNIYEKAALNFLRSITILDKVEKLPPNGEQAQYVINSELSSGEPSKSSRKKRGKSKSIDFKFIILPIGNRTKKITCYAMHKYTEQMGGAQDNQFQDLRLFLENSPIDREECFIAFADGEYYKNKIVSMKKEFDIVSKRRVFTLNEFEEKVINGLEI